MSSEAPKYHKHTSITEEKGEYLAAKRKNLPITRLRLKTSSPEKKGEGGGINACPTSHAILNTKKKTLRLDKIQQVLMVMMMLLTDICTHLSARFVSLRLLCNKYVYFVVHLKKERSMLSA